MNVIKKNIPNSITCINLLGGVAAIICAANGASDLWGLKSYQWAFIFIGISAVADFLDGFVARMLHAYSELGKELDSLCDLVSFGVAPAILLYYCILSNGAPEWLAWCSLLIPIGGVLRLARFNTDGLQSTTFRGLPIPANAIFWIGAVNMYYDNGLINNYILLALIIILPALMVCNRPMFSLKFKSLSFRDNAFRYLLILATVIFCVCLGVSGLAFAISFYILLSLFTGNTKYNRF
jgi:CDP-diacylglycerol---serine O-phosphatidyltransferase